MKQLLICTALLILGLNVFSQSTFQTSYGDVEIDNGKAITAITTGGYCVVSRNGNALTDNVDIVLYNIDDDGSLLWSAKLGTNKNDYPTDIIQTPDGGFAITGYTFGGFIDSTTDDIFIIKTDDQGFPLFSNTFGGPGTDEGATIMNSGDGGFYIAGSTSSYGNGLQSAFLLRTDLFGNLLWTNVNGASDSNLFSSICATRTQEILAAGSCYNPVTGDLDNYISLLDTNGSLLWAKRSGSSGDDYLNKIITTNDGGFLSVGASNNLSAGNFDFNVCKYDSLAGIVWSKNYGTLQYNQGTSIAICPNGDIIVTGSTNIGNNSSPLYQATILRLDSTGNLIWSNSYGDPSSDSEGEDIITGNSDAIIAIGYIKSFSDILGETHFIKTNANGNSGCYQLPLTLITSINTFTDSIGADSQNISMISYQINPNWQSFSNQFSLYCFNNSISNPNLNNSPMVFPNPGTGMFRIQTGISGFQSLEIYNAIGQKVIHKAFGEEFVNVDLSNYLPGIYYFKIDNSKSGKIILTGK